MSRTFAIVLVLLFATLTAGAQVVESPITLKAGIGGGVSLPSGTLSDDFNTGWNAGAKVRLGGWIPLNVVAVGSFNSLPLKSTGDAAEQIILGGGIEYAITSAVVHPYFGVEAYYVDYDNGALDEANFSRGGVGVGAGVEFALPGLGSFDTAVKYQYLNSMGKEDGEDDIAQIAATVSLMFDVF
jgi:hypothetical protein